MINDNSNNDSASSLKHKDIDIYQNHRQENNQICSDLQPYDNHFNNNQIENFVNPFNQKIAQSLTFKDSFRFSKKNNNQTNKQQNYQQQKQFFKRSIVKDSLQFHKIQNQGEQKQSEQFIFKGQLSGSLFSSQKSQKQEDKIKKNHNLQNFMSLLKQYYNQSYLMNRLQISRKSNSPASHLSIRRSDVPFFVTRQPILFQKKFYGLRSGYDLSGNFLCKLIGNKIYYKNVVNQQLQNIQQVKCQYIELFTNQSISPSLQIDAVSYHLFYYSNTHNEIVVLSLSKSRKNNNQICRIKTRTQRVNPLLYLIEINKQKILLLIGGYNSIHAKTRPDQVQGCKFIQIFPIDNWGTGIMQSRIIKLINGKIYPLIIFPVKIQLNDSILLVGGNTMARIAGGNLSFKEYKAVNRSSNVRGMYISTKNIIECIQHNKDITSLPNGNNISVQIEDKISLYNGYVDYVKSNQREKIRLFLPKMAQFYTLKILKKQVRIIKTTQNQQRQLIFDSSDSYHHLQMKCFKKPITKYFQINQKGFFQQKKINLANVNSFGLRNQWRCPCEFM